MAHTVNADHDAPLQLGIALQKALRVISQSTHDRDRQEHVDRDEHREQVEKFVTDQSVLNRQHDKESQHQTAVITAARRRQRHEFTQRKNGNQSEQGQRNPVPCQPADPEHQHHQPTGPEYTLEIAQVTTLLLGTMAVAQFAHGQQHSDDTGKQQNTEHNGEESTHLLGGTEVFQSLVHGGQTSRKAMTALRARSRKAWRSSPSCK